MIQTILELCDKAQEYLLTINVGNKNKTYTPTGTLKSGGVLKTYSFSYTAPGVNEPVTKTSTMTISTSGNIPNNYLTSVSTNKMIQDWEDYRDNHILTKINSETYISLSSMFYFLYLFRYFIDKKFCMFTDIYGKSYVWLYNTSTVTYSPSDMNLEDKVLSATDMDTYISTLISEIANRDTLQTLVASTSSNSCSSSSSSSSCSSSSSSSSCSSSSSSSSSLFIAYFNIG